MRQQPFFIILLLLLASICSNAQERPAITDDSALVLKLKNAEIKKARKDSINKTYSPRTAAIRSAILPGLGQIYNKKYWKLPIVYGALGTTAYIFLDNLQTYKDLKFAYAAKYKASINPADTADLKKIKPRYAPISTQSLRAGRDKFRQYIDYSAVFFLLFWGVNVVDATVDAHLKGFDVTPDLTLKIKPGHSEMANTNGVSLILTIGKNHPKYF